MYLSWPYRVSWNAVLIARQGFLWSALAHVVEQGLWIFLARFGGQLAEGLSGGAQSPSTTLLGALVVATALAGTRYGGAFVGLRAHEFALSTARLAAFDVVQREPLIQVEGVSPGRMRAIIVDSVEHIVELLGGFVRSLPSTVLGLIAIFIILSRVSLAFAFSALATVFIASFIVRALVYFYRNSSQIVQGASQRVDEVLTEQLGMLSTIQAFGRFQEERTRLEEALSDLVVSRVHHQYVYCLISAGSFVVMAGAGMLLLLASAHHPKTPSEMIQALLYCFLLFGPISNIIGFARDAVHAKAGSDALESLAREPSTPRVPSMESVRRGSKTRQLSLQNVSFCYPGGPWVLRGLDTTLAPGEIVALTGENGAGKTTLCRIIAGQLAITEGSIRVGGLDLSGISPDHLPKTIGFLAQNPQLFHRTIRDNLTFGKPEADEEELVQATSRAGCLDFIRALPLGFDTVLAPGGMSLSGGQRQRLQMARILLLDPEILVLDEPTAMLDGEAVEGFIETLRSVLVGKTVVISTHDERMLSLAHRIYTLRDGTRLTESTPARLVVSAG